MVFARMDLLCVRYPDGRFEELPKNSPGLKSPNGKDAAYWIREKHELHVRSPVNGNDNVVDALPDVTPQQMFWSVKGRALVYPVNTTPLVAVDVRSGKMTTLTNPGQNGPDTWLGWR